ncbi:MULTISPECIES: hypothetical protein [Cupriavidus]
MAVGPWTIHSDGIGADVEVEFQSTGTLVQLRRAAGVVVDGHVMVETLRACARVANTLERDRRFHVGESAAADDRPSC